MKRAACARPAPRQVRPQGAVAQQPLERRADRRRRPRGRRAAPRRRRPRAATSGPSRRPGTPRAIASSTGRPKPSYSEGKTTHVGQRVEALEVLAGHPGRPHDVVLDAERGGARAQVGLVGASGSPARRAPAARRAGGRPARRAGGRRSCAGAWRWPRARRAGRRARARARSSASGAAAPTAARPPAARRRPWPGRCRGGARGRRASRPRRRRSGASGAPPPGTSTRIPSPRSPKCVPGTSLKFRSWIVVTRREAARAAARSTPGECRTSTPARAASAGRCCCSPRTHCTRDRARTGTTSIGTTSPHGPPPAAAASSLTKATRSRSSRAARRGTSSRA